MQRGLCPPPSATLALQSSWCQSTSTHEEVQAGAGFYTTALPLPAAHPLQGLLSPTPPLPPLLPASLYGTDLLAAQCCGTQPSQELPQTILSLSLCVKLGGKLKQREMQTSAAGVSQGALLR